MAHKTPLSDADAHDYPDISTGENTAGWSRSYRRCRAAMLVVCALLTVAAAVSLGYFGYRLHKYLTTGGLYARTTVSLLIVVGHLLRAIAAALVAWYLGRLASRFAADGFALNDESVARHRRFWTVAACAIAIVVACSTLEVAADLAWGRYEFFRPEFQSGFALVSPERIEIRRASDDPVPGWLRQKEPRSPKDVFVAHVADIAGEDVQSVILRIAEVFPGQQAAELHLRFTRDGAKKMEELTRSHLGRPLAVLVDGEVRSTPRVFLVISTHAHLSNVFTLQEASRIIEDAAGR